MLDTNASTLVVMNSYSCHGIPASVTPDRSLSILTNGVVTSRGNLVYVLTLFCLCTTAVELPSSKAQVIQHAIVTNCGEGFLQPPFLTDAPEDDTWNYQE